MTRVEHRPLAPARPARHLGAVGDRSEITESTGSPAWLGPAALVFIVVISLLLLIERPVWDVDIFWQLRLGELILARGGPVPTEPFAARHLGEHLPSLAWAGQAFYAALRQVGGWSLLRMSVTSVPASLRRLGA